MKSALMVRLALLMAVTVALAAGCGSAGDKDGPEAGARGAVTGSDPAPPDPGQIQINWIGHWKGKDKREELVYEVKKEYEFLHPDVKINLVFNRDLEGTDPAYKKRAANAIIRMVETGETLWVGSRAASRADPQSDASSSFFTAWPSCSMV
jgi:ABC-type glycerol-3-phosphate transport system substrate-binding protein